LGRLAGGVAHDLNNILSVVTNYAEFVADRLPPGDEGRSDLERIRHAAERGTAFTRQLLTFARRGPAQRTELRLDELLTELRSLLGRALPENITFELRVPAEIWSVVADRGQIEQVMLNLVVNARDAMPDGGRLLVEASNVEYDEVSASQHADLHPGRYVLVTVSDTGHGMTKEVMDRVFEPFFTTKPTGQGTGLGLATVYGVVQQTGGRISIYSEVGRGTTMRVLLPAVRTSAPAVVESPQAAASVRPGTVILLVEDEDAVREAARRILTAAGYDVVAAPSAAVGLEKSAGRQKIDLLLTDMVMPGMSGRELAHRMRAARPNIRVVFMSGYAEEISTREDQLEGPLLMKPFTRRPLLDLVAATVQGMAA
jgi:CheY-like chemotaxis protein